jgi:hypothetical protein
MADSIRRLRVELEAGSTSFAKGFKDAATSVDGLGKSIKSLNIDRLHAEALRMNNAFDESRGRAGRLADSIGRVSTTLARSAAAFGLPTQALRTLDDVADVAELGFNNLTKAAVGFNAASIGVAGAGLAIGVGLGNILNGFQAVRTAADNATRGLFDFLAANKLFGESTRDAGAGQEAGISQFSMAMAAKHAEALEKQVASMKAQGASVKDIAKFYDGSLTPALEKKLGLTKEDVKAEEQHAAAAKKSAEAFRGMVDELSGATAQKRADELARAFHVLGSKGVADLDALRRQLEQLEKQGAKISDKGLLGVLRGGDVDDLSSFNLGDLGEDSVVNLVERVAKTGVQAQRSFDAMAASFAAAKVPAEDIADALDLAGASAEQAQRAIARIPTLGVGASLKAGLVSGLKGLPQVILGALQGGGDVGKSIGAHLGGSIGEGIAGQLTKKLSDVLGKTLGGALGSIIPGLGSLLGSQLGSLISKGLGKLGSLFGIGGNKQIQEVNRLRDAFLQAQGGFVELQKKLQGLTNQDLVKKIFNAKTVEEFNAAVSEVTGLLGNQEAATQALKEATDRYGFSIEELGPTFQRQELDAQAGQLLKDFSLLTASGIDVATVIAKMGPNLLEFVNTSRSAGQAIPEAMRPMIDQLLASGQLVDENGKAFATAEEAGITFAQSLTEGMAAVVDEIRNLVAALTGIPRDVTTTVHVNTEHTSTGGSDIPLPEDVQSFADGGIGNFGSGTLAMLHGWEAIVPLDRGGGARPGGTQVSITQNIKEDPYQSSEGRLALRRRTLQIAQREQDKHLSAQIQAGKA